MMIPENLNEIKLSGFTSDVLIILWVGLCFLFLSRLSLRNLSSIDYNVTMAAALLGIMKPVIY